MDIVRFRQHLFLLLGAIISVTLLAHFSFIDTVAQSSAPSGDKFVGTWKNSSQNATIIEASIVFTSLDVNGYSHYSVTLLGNCQLVPCNYVVSNDGDGMVLDYLWGYSPCGIVVACFPSYIEIHSISSTEIRVVIRYYSGTLAADEILTKPGGGKTCTATDSLDFTVTNASISTTPGTRVSTDLLVSAPVTNVGWIATTILLESSTNNPMFSMNENEFFVYPGESKTVSVSFEVPPNFDPSNYPYQLFIHAKDESLCTLLTTPTVITLAVLAPPDFTLSSNITSFNISRGDLSSSIITIDAAENSYGPISIDFQVGWDYDGTGLQPVNTTSSFDVGMLDLVPGETRDRELSLEPVYVDDSSLENYTGNFVYTIIANGLWTDAADVNHVITKRLDIPVSISEEPFDFALKSDKNILFLEKGKTNSVILNVEHLSGRRVPVSLSIIVLPLGLDMGLERVSGIPDYSSRLSVNAFDSDFRARDLEVLAVGGGISHSILIPLTQAPFTIVIDPNSTISPGNGEEIEVSIIPLRQGYNSTVTLTLSSSNLPESTSIISIEKIQGIPPFSTLLHIATDQHIAKGEYSVVVSGTDNEFDTAASHVVRIIPPSIQIDLEPRLDSLSIDGSPLTSKELIAVRTWQSGEEHRISALPEVVIDEGTKYVFDGWSDGVRNTERVIQVTEASLTIVGRYKPQFLLTLESQYGETRGSGWYDASSFAEFGIDASSNVPLFGPRPIFGGWTGPSASVVNIACAGSEPPDSDEETSNANSFFICMNRPQILIASWKEDTSGWASMAIAGIAGALIAGFGALSHFVVPKPVSKPGVPPGKGHTFELRIEVRVDEIGGIIQGTESAGTIPNFSESSVGDEIRKSFNQLLLADSVETFQQFKQFRVVKDWLGKTMSRNAGSSGGVPGASVGGFMGSDVISQLKKIIAENLGKATTPDLVRMIKHTLFSEVANRLQKGIESAAIPLSTIKVSIEFILLVDGVPVKNNLLRIPFEISPIAELKGVRSVLSGNVKSFYADFVDLRMRLHYLMPMMLGTKKVRISDNLVHIAKAVSLGIKKD